SLSSALDCVFVGAYFIVTIVALSAILCFFFFFFSSRRRHTRSKRDWSSDVCSSDLLAGHIGLDLGLHLLEVGRLAVALFLDLDRSEERRVGKECRSRWSPYH